MERKHSFLLSLLITGIIAINFFYFSQNTEGAKREKTLVARVIDGDTLETGTGLTLRLANVNAPEKKDPYSNLSADYLKQFINKTIEIESLGKERYGRTLGKIYLFDRYLNLELVSKGLVSKYLVQKNERTKFATAEKDAIEKGLGIWKKSQFYGCFKSTIDAKNEVVTLTNTCTTHNASLSLEGWILKDEGRTRYILPDVKAGRLTIHSGSGNSTSNAVYLGSKSNIWNDDSDTLYLFDKNTKIVHFHQYGY